MQNERLSITARYLLTYIRFRTNNNRQFFANNETIAQAIGCTTISTKVIINKLIRDGYITKTIDDKGRRNLALSGKEFSPLDGVNMNNADKRILKQEAQNQERDANYFKQQYEEAVERIKYLEDIIAQQDKFLKDFQQKQTQQRLEIQIPTPISRTEPPTQIQKTEEISQSDSKDPEAVIAEILAALKQQGLNYDYNE